MWIHEHVGVCVYVHTTGQVWIHECVCVAGCVYTPQDKWYGYMSVCGVCVYVHTTGQVVWIHEHVCV